MTFMMKKTMKIRMTVMPMKVKTVMILMKINILRIVRTVEEILFLAVVT